LAFELHLPLALALPHSYYIEIAGDATEVCSNSCIVFDVKCKGNNVSDASRYTFSSRRREFDPNGVVYRQKW
jgi:hypothetical protein